MDFKGLYQRFSKGSFLLLKLPDAHFSRWSVFTRPLPEFRRGVRNNAVFVQL